jgi:hypothetical protein
MRQEIQRGIVRRLSSCAADFVVAAQLLAETSDVGLDVRAATAARAGRSAPVYRDLVTG